MIHLHPEGEIPHCSPPSGCRCGVPSEPRAGIVPDFDDCLARAECAAGEPRLRRVEECTRVGNQHLKKEPATAGYPTRRSRYQTGCSLDAGGVRAQGGAVQKLTTGSLPCSPTATRLKSAACSRASTAYSSRAPFPPSATPRHSRGS